MRLGISHACRYLTALTLDMGVHQAIPEGDEEQADPDLEAEEEVEEGHLQPDAAPQEAEGQSQDPSASGNAASQSGGVSTDTRRRRQMDRRDSHTSRSFSSSSPSFAAVGQEASSGACAAGFQQQEQAQPGGLDVGAPDRALVVVGQGTSPPPPTIPPPTQQLRLPVGPTLLLPSLPLEGGPLLSRPYKRLRSCEPEQGGEDVCMATAAAAQDRSNKVRASGYCSAAFGSVACCLDALGEEDAAGAGAATAVCAVTVAGVGNHCSSKGASAADSHNFPQKVSVQLNLQPPQDSIVPDSVPATQVTAEGTQEAGPNLSAEQVQEQEQRGTKRPLSDVGGNDEDRPEMGSPPPRLPAAAAGTPGMAQQNGTLHAPSSAACHHTPAAVGRAASLGPSPVSGSQPRPRQRTLVQCWQQLTPCKEQA
jgi:hypothetical protein